MKPLITLLVTLVLTTVAQAAPTFGPAVDADKPVLHDRAGKIDLSKSEVGKEFTIECWQYIASATDAHPLFTIGEVEVTLHPPPKGMVKDPPRLALVAGDNVRTKSFAFPGKWHHLALVSKAGEAQFFINGCPDGDPFPAGSLSGKIVPHTPTDPAAELSEVAIFDRSLSAEQIQSHFKSSLPAHTVTVAGHRGDNQSSPENTNISYANAIPMGVPIVEMDLRLTKDNVLILLHDATVNRTSDGKGKIVEMNLVDAQKFDAGSWKNPKFKGEPIPTVETICHTCAGKAVMMLDLKCPGLAKPLAELKQKLNYPSDGWILAPWEDDQAIELHRELPDVTMVRLTGKVPTDKFDDGYFAHMKEIGYSGFSIAYPIVPQAFIDAAHKNGMTIWVWTINDAPDIAGAIAAGADGIVTDNVPSTLKLVRELTNH